MLAWIAVVAFIVQPRMCTYRIYDDGSRDYCADRVFAVIIFLLPLIFIALRSGFVDTASYMRDFNRTPVDMSQFSEFYHTNDRSYFFHALQMLFKIYIVDNAQAWIAVIAVIQAAMVIGVFRRYSTDMGMTVYLFMASGLVCSWMCNGIRQFLAVAVLFACTRWLLEKKWYFYLPVALLMMGLLPITSRFGLPEPPWFLCGIHQSAMVMLLASFFIQGKAFNRRVWIFTAVFVAVLLTGALDSILDTSVENTAYVKDMEYVDADTGTGWIRVAVESIPFIMSLIARKEICKDDTPAIIQLSVNASVVTTILYIASAFTSGIYVGRLPIFTELYNLILIPWLISHPYRQYKYWLRPVVIVCYLGYFFFQIQVAWNGVYYQSELLGINV